MIVTSIGIKDGITRQELYGGDNTGTTVILIAFVIPLFNLLSVVALGLFSNNKQSKIELIQQVLKNPLIISSIVAFFFIITGIRMPLLFEETISDIAGVATPLALIVLGLEVLVSIRSFLGFV